LSGGFSCVYSLLASKGSKYFFFCTFKIIIFVRIIDFEMDTKLTLKLDKEVIDKAKTYASQHQISLSKLIEAYLKSITSKEEKAKQIPISAFVKSLSSPSGIPADYDYKKDYQEYLEEKYR